MTRIVIVLVLAAACVGCRSGQLVLSQKTTVMGPYIKVETELLSRRGEVK